MHFLQGGEGGDEERERDREKRPERLRKRKVWVGWLFAFFLNSPKWPVLLSTKPELPASFSHYADSGFMMVM